MKIKLQDYGLISIEWIDDKISEFENRDGHDYYKGQLHILQSLKQQLIPSEKLAEVSFNTGFNSGMELSKQEFLESEIEILCNHSIEWLENKVKLMVEHNGCEDLLAVLQHIKQAKEIHKQEIIEAYDNIVVDDSGNIISGEQYYETTFKK